MKVLGFVNRYSRGVQAVQDELRTNGNGEADFKLHLGTAFLVIENIAKNKEPRKEPRKELEEILTLIRSNPTITYSLMMEKLKLTKSTLYERVKELKEMGLLKREGGRSAGVWIVIE